jgi:SAM-dependent methyltransferase
MAKQVLTSDNFWKGYDDISKWRGAMQHDFSHPSRQIAYDLVRDLFKHRPPEDNTTLDFAEIGFGQAYDFAHCFKELHDQKWINYTGFDHTPEFVEYAKTDFPEYKFIQGDFVDVPRDAFDVTYTRHTLQHAAPENYQDWIRAMLNATRKTAIIVWRFPPSNEHIVWNDGWNNRWDKDVVHAVIRGRGFSIQEIPVNEEDVIYKMVKCV